MSKDSGGSKKTGNKKPEAKPTPSPKKADAKGGEVKKGSVRVFFQDSVPIFHESKKPIKPPSGVKSGKKDK